MFIKRGLKLVVLVFALLWGAWTFAPDYTANTINNAIAWAIDETAQAAKNAARLKIEELLSRKSEPAKTLRQACQEKNIPYPPKNLRIVVDKSDFELCLYSGDELIKAYPVSLGKDPVGDKEKRGDNRTPEGGFYICQKAKNPAKADLGSRWLRLSYPNKEDAARGLRSGLINSSAARQIEGAIRKGDTPPQGTVLGGGIGIHGGSLAPGGKMLRTWTQGCVALFNRDIEEFYDFVSVGTPVVIQD